MRSPSSVTLFTAACLSALAWGTTHAESLSLKTVTAQQVLSVKVGSFREFPAAFDKLTQYCEEDDGIDILSPQMSLGSSENDMYAAVAFEGATRGSSEVKIFELPAATVAVATHQGPYYWLPSSVKKLVNAARNAGYTPDEKLLVRLIHKNNPETTPADELVTEIHLPVVKQ